MAALGANVLTLADWGKRIDPDGKIADVTELLQQDNEILLDMPFYEGNLPTGHRVSMRTGLPTAYWRMTNQGIPPSKSTTAQSDEQCGMLEAWSEVDKDLAELNGNVNEFRMSEAHAFIESLNQEMASTLFYGTASAPEEFVGLTPRYNDIGAGAPANAQNIIDAGGTGSDNTSIWLAVWGQRSGFGIFPKGSKAGIMHEDLGLQTIETTAGIAGNRMRAYQEHWQWKCGLALRDWRFFVRIANIDVSAVLADGAGSSVKLMEYMVKALHRVPSLRSGKPAFYMNRTVRQMLDIQAMNKSNVYLMVSEEEGRLKTSFRGVPLRTVDVLTETEARVV